jgi:energy-coupling factor transporter ATP-binding protein EcfA2
MDTAGVVDALIEACGLEEYRTIQSGSLSGGNKRKLSVALALIGGPSVVLLDEPSAGMDPHARRQLWDVIVFVAEHSSVVLTTHHLEEVDKLAHRVGIMDRGLMKCLGTLGHLKKKFGGGFELTLKVNADHMTAARDYISKTFPEALLVEERHERLIYSLPAESTDLADLFEQIFKAKEDSSLGIEDYMVQQTALEQVFLRIAEQNARAEEESKHNEADNERLSKSNRSQPSQKSLHRTTGSTSQLANEPLDTIPRAGGYSATLRQSKNRRQKSDEALPLLDDEWSAPQRSARQRTQSRPIAACGRGGPVQQRAHRAAQR